MGYSIITVKRKKSGLDFKIRFQKFVNGRRNSKDLPLDKWLSVGFQPSMTIDEAKGRAKQLNAQLELQRHEERRNSIHARLKQESLVECAHLPELLLQEFEKKKINDISVPEKAKHRWTTCKRAIRELKINPLDWADEKQSFYNYFAEHQYSTEYVKSLILYLNKWGQFVAKKEGKFFESLPTPSGTSRKRIKKANELKLVRDGGMASDALLPGILESKRSELKPEHYNWLYLSVWLGLRPSEVDSLKTVRIETVSGVTVLWVWQTKVEDTKPIPLIRPEQLLVIDIIKNKNFARPLGKTVHRHFGERIGLYGGRKGFVDLMLGYGYQLEQISVWMGHVNINRTWQSYKDKTKNFIPV